MSTKILCVDDDPNILSAFQRNLRKQFSLEVAGGGEEALDLMAKSGPYAVVVADMQMCGMNGVSFLARAQQLYPDTVRIMLTGNADQQTALQAVNLGRVFQFLTKPCSAEVLAMALQSGLKQHRLITAEKDLLERTLNGAIQTLTDILSVIDPQSFGHSQTLRDHMRGFAKAQNQADTWALEMAAMLCPVGHVSIPPVVLQKTRAGLTLTGQEKDMITRVPQVGSDLIAGIPRLETVAQTIRYQAKNFDGTGFPSDSVRGSDIPVGARVLHVLYDMVRLEERGVARTRAIENMQKRVGVYDPDVLAAVSAHFDIFIDKPTEMTATRKVSLRELRSGMVLAADLLTKDNMLIVRSGTQISSMLLERLHNFAQVAGVQEPIGVQVEG
jgi:response regulator RpfG family c-di-GMP phosphodiesterase